MHMNCCVANGPRGLMLLPTLAVMRGADGPVVQFYEKGTATIPLASGKTVRLEFHGDYPFRARQEIVVRPEGTQTFTLTLRIPAWSRQTELEINGEEASGATPGKYARLTRTWQPGDRVRLTFEMPVHVVRDPGGSGQVAVMQGPIVLALDKRISLPQRGITAATIMADARGIVPAVEVREELPDGMRMAMDVPLRTTDGRTVQLRMCDYASAGRTWSPRSSLRVWLPQPLNLESPIGP